MKHEKDAKAKFLTDQEIISQSILFFIAGFETTSSAISGTIFEMVQQPHLQERLCQEINDKLEGIDERNLNEYYDRILNGIPYLDACFKETLRKYPPLARLERRLSTDSYKLGD